jgi:hypothetical protein
LELRHGERSSKPDIPYLGHSKVSQMLRPEWQSCLRSIESFHAVPNDIALQNFRRASWPSKNGE